MSASLRPMARPSSPLSRQPLRLTLHPPGTIRAISAGLKACTCNAPADILGTPHRAAPQASSRKAGAPTERGLIDMPSVRRGLPRSRPVPAGRTLVKLRKVGLDDGDNVSGIGMVPIPGQSHACVAKPNMVGRYAGGGQSGLLKS
jgi:hypothetical protein